MSVMTAAGTGLPTDRPLTVEDLDLLPDDGNKYELDDGVLIVSPAPAMSHQIVLARVYQALVRDCPPEFLVLLGPGVEMSEFQYPDPRHRRRAPRHRRIRGQEGHPTALPGHRDRVAVNRDL